MGRVREEKRRRKKIKKEKVSEERRSRCSTRQESRETLCFFQWFVALEGRKVGSLKRRVRSHLARWEMKSCTPLWREAHFKVKMYKHLSFGELLEVEMSKKCTRLWREAPFQVKTHKHTILRPLLEVEMAKKCTPLWREALVEQKTEGHRALLDVQVILRVCTLPKMGQTWGFCSSFNTTTATTLHSAPLHYITLPYATLHLPYITLQQLQLQLHYTNHSTLTTDKDGFRNYAGFRN